MDRLLDRLPTEIVATIFELAAIDDRQTAYRLCLVSRTVKDIVLPVLYRHIYLSGTDQIRRFNASIKMSPKLGDLIQGMTLHDAELAALVTNHVNDVMLSLDESEEWVGPWKTLIRYIGVMSRQHHLSTLVLSIGAYRRLQYHETDNVTGIGRAGPLEKQLHKSNLKLQHLVVSHADLVFITHNISMKKLTWYGCEIQWSFSSDGFAYAENPEKLNENFRAKELREVQFMMGDNFHLMHEIMHAKKSKEGEDWLGSLTLGWTELLSQQMEALSEALPQPPEFSVYLHRETQESKKYTIDKFGSYTGSHVEVGLWGNSDDTDQRQAEMESFASKGWLSGETKAASSKRKSKSKKPKRREGERSKLWCGCIDMEACAAM